MGENGFALVHMCRIQHLHQICDFFFVDSCPFSTVFLTHKIYLFFFVCSYVFLPSPFSKMNLIDLKFLVIFLLIRHANKNQLGRTIFTRTNFCYTEIETLFVGPRYDFRADCIHWTVSVFYTDKFLKNTYCLTQLTSFAASYEKL